MTERVPDVSVIIAAYDCMPYFERTVASLLSQTIGLERMQVLIIDEGSTDGTAALADRVAAECPSFEVAHSAPSGGPATPRNAMLKRARGRYIFILDSDDYLSDDALEAMVRAADQNGTDVVMARMKGLGGRGTPRRVFARTMQRTDVHSSPAYWSLNPLKLFRTETVRDLGLQFATDLPWGEDQPFVAGALLSGCGITILADKDYVFWVYRKDAANITTRLVSLASRMPVVDRMFDIVAASVAPGPERDRLMHRHFHVEMISSAFEGYRMEPDTAQRAAAFERFRTITDAYYNEGIEAALQPPGRVLMRLVAEGRMDEFAEYLAALAEAGTPPTQVEAGRVFLALPWFRDPRHGLPDGLFDVTAQLAVQYRVEPLVIERSGARLTGTCRLGALTDRVTDVTLVARSRDKSVEVAVPLAHEVVFDEVHPFVNVEDTVTAEALAAHMTPGIYDFFIRVSAGPTWRERRLSECASPSPEPRVVQGAQHLGVAKSGLLTTTSGGNLSLRVTEVVSGWRRLARRGRRLAGRIAKRAGLRGSRTNRPG
jgi:CDP-glycerol glycerophosphotransferase